MASCSSLKPAASKPVNNASSKNQSSIEFINNVSLSPEPHHDKTGGVSASNSNNQPTTSAFTHSTYNTGIENYSPLQFKYAILMDATVEEMNNANLLTFIEDWYGTRYRYGGSAKDGIDCSAFASSLMSAVYGVNNLPRISKDQYKASKRVKRNELREGDLVFFHTLGRRKSVTHVGVYLRNGKFIHASISGVMISSLDDGYYAQHFVGAGRVM
jgi:cell wall-associated NlpC family hydrolase